MAKYASTSELDLDAEVYSDAEEAASGSDAADSDDSGNSQDSGDDDDDADSDGGDRRILPGVRFTGSGEAIFADTSSSDSSSDSGLAEFDEQAPSTDVAKTGETSTVNVEAGEASNPAGSESAPQTESQPAAPEASDVAKPASPAPTAATTEEPTATTEVIPATDPATATAAST